MDRDTIRSNFVPGPLSSWDVGCGIYAVLWYHMYLASQMMVHVLCALSTEENQNIRVPCTCSMVRA